MAIFAAMTHPSIKMRFLPILQQTAPHLTLDSLKQKFIECASSCNSIIEYTTAPKNNSEINFLDFGELDRKYVFSINI